jgi:hypothetical protein
MRQWNQAELASLPADYPPTTLEENRKEEKGMEGKGMEDRAASPPPPGSQLELPSEAELWNLMIGDQLPAALNCSISRMKHLQARRRDLFWVANLDKAIAKILESEFCKGYNDNAWIATFDWLLRPDSVAKVMEGKYDNRKPTKRNERNEAIGITASDSARRGRETVETIQRRMAKTIPQTPAPQPEDKNSK